MLLTFACFYCRVYRQPPNCATPAQRQTALAREGLAERLTEAGRTATFRFAEPTDERPCLLAGNVKSYGMFWQEWIHGIAGNKPARLWERVERGHNSTFSKRKPICLLLDRMVHYGKKSPPEAFRVLEMHFLVRTLASQQSRLERGS